jgi:hypothetical protein
MTLSGSPEVTVLFTGLVILRFDKVRPRCEINLHRVSSDHVPSITVTQKEIAKQSRILWKHYGHLPDELWLDVVNMNRKIEVNKHGDTLDRTGTTSGQENDIRWVIDLESADFHDRPIAIRPDGVGFGMYMTKGHFYTAAKTDPKFQVKRRDGGKPDAEFHRVASVIAADIVFEHADSALDLHWGRDAGYTLRLEKKPNVTYEIVVDNSPALEAEARTSDDMHSELKRYYQVLSDVAPGERFDLVFDGPISPDVPCMGLILGAPS